MLLTVERVLFLKSVDIFDEVDDDAIVGLASELQETEFPAGTRIFTEGDPGRELFLVVHGKVRVHKGDETIKVLGYKGVFGELAALDRHLRLVSVTAEEDTGLLSLSHTVLFEELLTNVELARGVIHFLVARLRGQQRRRAGRTDRQPGPLSTRRWTWRSGRIKHGSERGETGSSGRHRRAGGERSAATTPCD
jgi:CRP-like cAMP-binding protein